jgi:hypothetical protein
MMKPVPRSRSAKTVALQHAVQVRPRLCCLDRILALAPDPAQQAFQAAMPLHVRGPACRAALPGAVIVRRQAILAFQLGAQLTQFRVVIVRVVDRVAGRVNLIDRDVQVQAVGVMVERTDPLMRAQSQALAQARSIARQVASSTCSPGRKLTIR